MQKINTALLRSTRTPAQLRCLYARMAPLSLQHVTPTRFSTKTKPALSVLAGPIVFQSVRLQSGSASPSTQKACSKCQKVLPLDSLSCTDCGTLQPLPSELDAYALLGLDHGGIGSHGWDVDLNELKALWRRRVALSHPDRMNGKDEVRVTLFLLT